jgi:excisionase family DNA binding protein
MMQRAARVIMKQKSRLSQRRYVSLSEAADYLSVSPRTVRRMISQDELPGYRVGNAGLLRVDMGEVQSIVRQIPTARSP